MDLLLTLVLVSVINAAVGIEVAFPPGFKFGASTAAYQVEGAWNVSDKSESIWDRFTHQDPTVITDLSNGDVACDSYHQWQRDIDMCAELGLDFYRFSISWSRLLPNGFSNKISVDGTRYYNDLIDGLLAKGVEPIVTLYHWDLPQHIQDLGGWTNPIIVHIFGRYARSVFALFADRVKTWITFNEPIVMCDYAYSTGSFAPGIVDRTHAPFLCNKHILLAHATAWRIYDQEFKPLYHGKVSLSNQIVWYAPFSNKDATLAKLVREFVAGRYAHPIYSKEGGWPPSIIKVMKEVSAKQGYEVSRLPEFTPEEIEFVRGTYDFFGLNYYTCRLARRAKPGERVDSIFIQGIPELDAVMEVVPGQGYGVSNYLVICPEGLRSQMAWIKDQYGDVPILITENGYSSAGMDLKDEKRIEFIKDHLEQVLLSIKLDGVNVTGYTYWALMDNLEWGDGFEAKFGLYEVDFNSVNRTRTPRESAYYYSALIRDHALKISDRNVKYFLNYFSAVVATAVSADVCFPKKFKLGVATASYQVEGAWNVSDKGESIWDRFTHSDPSVIGDYSNGDVACDSYHQWQRDVEMCAEMGVDHYRLSLSWPRLLPKGFANKVSQDGVSYYNNIINGLLKKGIEPIVTLYHWDLPQSLQNLGGWTNPLMVNYFVDYARVAFKLFGDRVKTWITFNEPIAMCDYAYNSGKMAPGVKEVAYGGYLCNIHLLLAHAKAYRSYDREFRPKYRGRVSIANHYVWYEAATPEDDGVAELYRHYVIGRYSNPIYSKDGGWPPSVESAILNHSLKNGFTTSRLRKWTQEEIQLIKGTADFLAFNMYTARLVRATRPGENYTNIFLLDVPEIEAKAEKISGDAPYGFPNDMTVNPKGIRRLMAWLKKTYGDWEMLITENGYSTKGSDLDDYKRIDYIREHLIQVHKSIELDGVRVLGYTHWSLMDNFEWADGYASKFGLYEVDFDSKERTRTPRASAKYYKEILQSRCLPEKYSYFKGPHING